MAQVKCTLTMPKGLRDVLDPLKADVRAAVVRTGLLAAALYWAEKILPVHFTRRAYNLWRDSYEFRGKRYEKRKDKLYGHRDPMVLTGAFKASILGRLPTLKHQATGRSLRVTVQLPYGRAANFHTGKGRHDFKKSLTAWNQTDERVLTEIVGERAHAALEEQVASGGTVTQSWAA